MNMGQFLSTMFSKVLDFIIHFENTGALGIDKFQWVLKLTLGFLMNAFKLPSTAGRVKVWTDWINATVAVINLEVWHKATPEDYDEVHNVKADDTP